MMYGANYDRWARECELARGWDDDYENEDEDDEDEYEDNHENGGIDWTKDGEGDEN